MNALRDKYAIVGTGKSRLGQVGANSLSLLEEAIKNALDEAGLSGMALILVNYVQEMPVLRDEVLPRLERLQLRQALS